MVLNFNDAVSSSCPREPCQDSPHQEEERAETFVHPDGCRGEREGLDAMGITLCFALFGESRSAPPALGIVPKPAQSLSEQQGRVWLAPATSRSFKV